MARLREPSAIDQPLFIKPVASSTKSTRTSPRKAVPESPTTRKLRYSSSQSPDDSLLVPKIPVGESPARKQRVLRPVASNSRLLGNFGDDSFNATPDRKERRALREESGRKPNYSYSKTIARSLAKRPGTGKSGKLDVLGEQETVMDITDVEKSLICGEEEDSTDKDKENMGPNVEDSGVDEDDEEPVVHTRNRRWQPRTRRIPSDSEDDEVMQKPMRDYGGQGLNRNSQRQVRSIEMPPPLVSTRSPFRKGHSTTSTWAQGMVDIADSPTSEDLDLPGPPVLEPNSRQRLQSSSEKRTQSTTTRPVVAKSYGGREIIDLTSSPEPEEFDVPLASPDLDRQWTELPQTSMRMRTASFAASSRPTTAASDDVGAHLHYSPTPIKLRSPRKAPPVSRPITPPSMTSPSKLVSPSKKKPNIPAAPNMRPSIDAFWDPAVVNDWNDKHSPLKPLLSPRKQKLFEELEGETKAIMLSDDEGDALFPPPAPSPRKKKSELPSKKVSPSVAGIRAQRKDFAARKHAMAEAFLAELDNNVANGRIAELCEATGGIKLVWSKTLKTTAGRANWRREQIRLRTGPLPSDLRIEIRHHCSIELAEKVIDDEERLYNVLAHEYCHLTTFMISEVRNNPHGVEFKSWGAKVSRAFAHKGVHVTTKHSYKIDYKYIWECAVCGYEFKRHSKSVDPIRHSCGRCKGKLVQTKPTPRGQTVSKDGKKEGGEYQTFVKANFGRVKKEMVERGEDVQMGKVMEAVAREYREKKAKDKQKLAKVEEVESALEALKL